MVMPFLPSDCELEWGPGDEVWHAVFDASQEWGVPHAVRVVVFRSLEALQAASRDPDCGAHSVTFWRPDADGVGAVVMLAQPVELSSIIHEVTHVALLWSRRHTRRKQRAFNFLDSHSEFIPTLVGNLSSVIWHSMPDRFGGASPSEL